MPNTNCPVCGQNDRVVKVSGVYATGFATGSFSGPTGGVALGSGTSAFGSYTTLVGNLQSRLSEQLTPPEKPQRSCLGRVFILGLAVMGSTVLLMACFTGAFFTQVAMEFKPAWVIVAYTVGLMFTCILMIAAAVAFHRLGNENVSRETPRWEKAMERWSQLYYCMRDDVVFNPNEGKSISPSGLETYLFS